MAITKIQAGALPAGVVTVDAIADTSITHAKLHTDMDLSAKTVVLPTLSTLDVSGNVTVAGTVDGVDIQTLNTAVIANTAKVTNYNQTKADIEALGIAASSITGALPAISGAALTDVAKLSVGTSAPSTPAVGDQWFDTTSNAMKVWSGTLWNQMSNKFSATGGTESTYSSGGINYKAHTFTSSGTFTAESEGSVDYLVVAGGAGGGDGTGGGGGGAGGYRSSVVGESSGGGSSAESKLTVSSGSYSITVGAGGAGAYANTGLRGINGSNCVLSSITSIGGGGGGGEGAGNYSGASGGSGGGGCYPGTGGSGTSGQGFTGGNGTSGSLRWLGGGGGGASAVGQNASSFNGGNGGNGVSSSITGSSVTRAGGGGGAAQSAGGGTVYSGSGGSGGGGAGAADQTGSQSVNGGNATANTGSGGGGCPDATGTRGGNGGSGIVIIRYVV